MTNNKETGYKIRYEDMVWCANIMCEVYDMTKKAYPYDADPWKKISYFENLFDKKTHYGNKRQHNDTCC